MNIENHLITVSRSTLQAEIIDGLTRDQKVISSKFFYDQRGSELFGEITQLLEYYPTRTEMGILEHAAPELSNVLQGKSIVELGSGDASKISILLNAIPSSELSTMTCFPVDVSESALIDTAKSLTSKFPQLTVNGIVADFVSHMDKVVVESPKVICFFGSTLGNFTQDVASKLLQSIHDIMNPGDQLLLGLDRLKDIDVLLAAYNDEKGVTAEFNLNVLSHVNSIVGSNFNPDLFDHKAIYNPDKERIEMHLVAAKDQQVNSPEFSFPIQIKKGETIHTENSHKYSMERINLLIDSSNFHLKDVYSDEKEWFSLLRLTV